MNGHRAVLMTIEEPCSNTRCTIKAQRLRAVTCEGGAVNLNSGLSPKSVLARIEDGLSTVQLIDHLSKFLHPLKFHGTFL